MDHYQTRDFTVASTTLVNSPQAYLTRLSLVWVVSRWRPRNCLEAQAWSVMNLSSSCWGIYTVKFTSVGGKHRRICFVLFKLSINDVNDINSMNIDNSYLFRNTRPRREGTWDMRRPQGLTPGCLVKKASQLTLWLLPSTVLPSFRPSLEPSFPFLPSSLSHLMFTCSLCKNRFRTKRALRDHAQDVHVPCTSCKQVFQDRGALDLVGYVFFFFLLFCSYFKFFGGGLFSISKRNIHRNPIHLILAQVVTERSNHKSHWMNIIEDHRFIRIVWSVERVLRIDLFMSRWVILILNDYRITYMIAFAECVPHWDFN